jgi:hypothetical protein
MYQNTEPGKRDSEVNPDNVDFKWTYRFIFFIVKWVDKSLGNVIMQK